jgi:MFS transporter, DHA2 family, methylenomycin A resistance protein
MIIVAARTNSFGSSVTELWWVADAYTIVFASLLRTAGVLGDRIGAKRVFTSSQPVMSLRRPCSRASEPASASPVMASGRQWRWNARSTAASASS